jgi:hypothetical protein
MPLGPSAMATRAGTATRLLALIVTELTLSGMCLCSLRVLCSHPMPPWPWGGVVLSAVPAVTQAVLCCGCGFCVAALLSLAFVDISELVAAFEFKPEGVGLVAVVFPHLDTAVSSGLCGG